MGEVIESITKQYELSVLIIASDAEQTVADILVRHGGTIDMKSPFHPVRLAYPIRKQESAQFGFYYVTASPESVAEISRELSLQASVLRFLIVTPSPKPAQSRRPQQRPPEAKPQAQSGVLSNEALEAKLEEILK